MENKPKSFQDIINDEKPVLIDFFAEWCGPCKMMTPILQQLHSKMGESVRIIKVDVDRNQPLAQALQIQGVPTLMLYQSGNMLWRQSGVVSAVQLENIINTKVAKAQ